MRQTVKDPFPKYPSAGLHLGTDDDTAYKTIFPAGERPPSPESIKKYRKSFRQQHGVHIPHYGSVGDPMPGQHHRYGLERQVGFHTEDVFNADGDKGLRGFVNEVKEMKYDSQSKTPLGRTVDRAYRMPEAAAAEEFKFGVHTQANEFSCKEIVSSGLSLAEPEAIRQQYLKSHKSYGPAEQINRQYNWPVDAKDFRFGKVGRDVENMNVIMRPDAPDESFPKTKIIAKNQLDFDDYYEDHLGKPANLGQANPYVSDATTYGKPLEKSEWDAGQCIRGSSSLEAALPDADLGRATHSGFRNTTKPGDEGRSFGVPSVRLDVKPPENVSVADTQNYGTDPKVIDLLYPESYEFMGLTEQDFDLRRPREEIRDIFARIGYQFPAGKFQAIFQKSKELEGTILDKVSCRCFLQSMRYFEQI